MVSPDDVLRLAIWVSVAAWAMAIGGCFLRSAISDRIVRLSWTIGLLAYLVHVVAAFAGPYAGSHAIAMEETARQTAELTGIRTGFGLWLNYLVGILWFADVVRCWKSASFVPGGRLKGPWLAWQVFLTFMIFNGAIIFAHGPIRWFGVTLFAILAGLGLRARVRAVD